MNLEALDDDELADLIRDREKAFGDALAELGRRQDWYGLDKWSDESAMAALAAVRNRADHPRRPKGTAPTLFRAGYEWAALSIFAVLESVLDRPSEDAVAIHETEAAGRGLFRMGKVAKVFDPRRRAALDLIELLEGFVQLDLRGFFSLPKRRSPYRPTDDENNKYEPRVPHSSVSPLLP